MVVKLDLRTEKVELQSETKKNSLNLLVFAAAALFFISALLLFGMCGYRLWTTRNEKTMLEDEMASDTDTLQMMEMELTRLTKENAAIEGRLDFLLEDAPTVEFLYELGNKQVEGVVVEGLAMTPAKATISGLAFADEDVLAFGDDLLSASCVSAVALPVISSTTRAGVPFKQFSIEITFAPLKDVLLNRAEKREPVSDESKGAVQR